MACPYYSGGIWKRLFHSENVSNVFRSHYAGGIRFAFEENSFGKITWLSWRHHFRKAPFSKCFPSPRKREYLAFSNSTGSKRVFKKVRFQSWRIKPWPNEAASSRKWTQVELAWRLVLGGQTDSQVFSQVHASRKKKNVSRQTYPVFHWLIIR